MTYLKVKVCIEGQRYEEKVQRLEVPDRRSKKRPKRTKMEVKDMTVCAREDLEDGVK